MQISLGLPLLTILSNQFRGVLGDPPASTFTLTKLPGNSACSDLCTEWSGMWDGREIILMEVKSIASDQKGVGRDVFQAIDDCFSTKTLQNVFRLGLALTNSSNPANTEPPGYVFLVPDAPQVENATLLSLGPFCQSRPYRANWPMRLPFPTISHVSISFGIQGLGDGECTQVSIQFSMQVNDCQVEVPRALQENKKRKVRNIVLATVFSVATMAATVAAAFFYRLRKSRRIASAPPELIIPNETQ